VAAYTERSRGYKGISLFIVDKEGEEKIASRKLRKEGSRSSDTAELVFEDCFVPKEDLIGETEGGFSEIMHTLVEGRVSIAAGCVGIAQAAFEASLAYARDRVCFGKPIMKYQGIAFQIADMAVEIEVARTMVYRAASLIDQGEDCAMEASIAKLFASEMAGRVTDAAMQVHGGYGYMREFPVGRYWRDARQLRIGEGTSEIHRIIISRRLGML
jgi:alkylation response protein AidB-like acyl-CoA dehydrogenase